MTEFLLHLFLAMGLFAVSHVVLPILPLRSALISVLGEQLYLAFYSILSIGLLAWVIMAYKAAPKVELFEPNTAMRHASLTLMLMSSFFTVAGIASRNPSLVPAEKLGWRPEAKGIFNITCHPLMWGIALWGFSHALANGHAAALALFGGMAALAVAGALHIDFRKRKTLGDTWLDFEKQTSFIPLAAIAAGRIRMEKGEIFWWQNVTSGRRLCRFANSPWSAGA